MTELTTAIITIHNLKPEDNNAFVYFLKINNNGTCQTPKKKIVLFFILLILSSTASFCFYQLKRYIDTMPLKVAYINQLNSSIAIYTNSTLCTDLIERPMNRVN